MTLTTVLFRVAGQGLEPAATDAVQGEVRRRLLTSGRVLIGRTKMPARGGRPAAVALKLTLLNPNATAADIEDLLDLVVATGLDVLAEAAKEPGPLAPSLDDPDGSRGGHAHLNAILRCYTRETAIPVAVGPLTLPVGESTVSARVEHASRTGLHQFTDVQVDGCAAGVPEDLVTAAVRRRGSGGDRRPGARGRRSRCERRAVRGQDRRRAWRRVASSSVEQALLFGHLNHPAPKSRDGLSGDELAAYSPELGGRFAVHWFEADAELVSSDQVAGAPSLQGLDAVQLMGALAGITPSAGRVLIPAHPWQAAAVLERPRVAALVTAAG